MVKYVLVTGRSGSGKSTISKALNNIKGVNENTRKIWRNTK